MKNKQPAIRFKGFTEDWKQYKLKELGKAQSGVGFPDNEQGGTSGLPFYKVSDMNNYDNEHEMKSANNYVSAEQISHNNWKPITIVPAVIFAKVGAAIMLNRKRLVRFPFLIDNNIMAYKFDDTWNINFGKTIFERIDLTSLVQVGVLPSYNVSDIENLEMNIPKKKEQNKIGGFFKQLDNLINLYQRKCDKLVNIKKSLLEKMFPKSDSNVPEIRFKGFTEVWEQNELGKDIAYIVGGGTPSTLNSAYWNGSIDWYSPTEIGKTIYANGSEKKITELGLQKSSAKLLPAERTILFSSRASIGDMAILRHPGATNQGFQSLVLKDNIDVYFIYSMGYLIKKFAKKNASGSTFLEITGKMLGSMKIRLPSTKEQKKIGEFFKRIDNLINLYQRKIEKMQNIKKFCLDKMFV